MLKTNFSGHNTSSGEIKIIWGRTAPKFPPVATDMCEWTVCAVKMVRESIYSYEKKIVV